MPMSRLCGGKRTVVIAETERAAVGRMKPGHEAISSVVLPDPEGPSSVTNSPGIDGQRHVVQRTHAAVVLARGPDVDALSALVQ